MQAQISKPKKKMHPAMIYLKKYPAMKKRRDKLKEELLMIRQNATRGTSRMTAERMSGTYKKDGMANAAIKAVDVDKRLTRIISSIEEELDFRVQLIEELENEWEKTILTMRYISGMPWEGRNSILSQIPFERTAMYEIHGEALEHFWAIYNIRKSPD